MPGECIECVSPRKQEGAGNAGCRPHPRALRAKRVHFCARKQRQGSRNNRHSLRNGLRLIRVLLGVPGLLASVARAFVTRKLDPSFGGSGPHDFAVRARIARLATPARPSHPDPTFVAIGQTPLQAESGRREISTIFRKTEAKFCAKQLKLSICLKDQTKQVVWHSR